MRAFLAIELPHAVRETIAALSEKLRPRLRAARFVAPDKVHLTIRFLGETTPETSDRLSEGLEPRLSGCEAFVLRFGGLGFFPGTSRARVLWLGVLEPPRALFELHETVEAAVRDQGFAPENRPFRPHLTIARLRGVRVDRAMTSEDPTFPLATVSELVLFESLLSPRGASYRPLRRFALTSGANNI